MKTRLLSLLLLVGSCCIGFLAIEAGARLTHYRDLLGEKGLPDGYFVADAVMGADLARNFKPARFRFKGPGHDVFTNDLGCFDNAGPVAEGYILVLGDSQAWGFAPLQDTWAARLEKIAGRQVVKCGVPGTGTKHQLVKAKGVVERIAHPPSLVILLYSDNDFNDDALFPGFSVVRGQRVSNLKSLDLKTGALVRYNQAELSARYERFREGPANRIREFFKVHSVIANLAVLAYRNIRSLMTDPILDWNSLRHETVLTNRYQYHLAELEPVPGHHVLTLFEDHLAAIREIKSFAAKIGAPTVLLDTALRRGARGFRRRLSEFFAAEFPHYLNVGDRLFEMSLDGKRIIYPFNGHYNLFANHEIARMVHRYLTSKKLLPAGTGARQRSRTWTMPPAGSYSGFAGALKGTCPARLNTLCRAGRMDYK